MDATNPESETSNGGSNIPPFNMPSRVEAEAQMIWENCFTRTIISGVMGGGLGLFMGMFLGALENPIAQDTMSGKQQFIYTAKQMGRKSLSSCIAFGTMGAIFSGVECVVEKRRAKHDIKNTAIAGCATGGVMSGRAGPQAACIGCAGFAVFSVLIEKFLDRNT
ncbi:hypothetical protein ACFE04_009431 [Oxalis oulophora]